MRIAVIDLETTSLSAETGKIVEAAVISDTTLWQSRFNPGCPIPPEASAVHHIVDADVVDHPTFSEEIWRQATDNVDVLVAHNAAFDKMFLPDHGQVWCCTYRCGLHLYPDAGSHSLQSLRYYLGLQPDLPRELNPHCALYDAIVAQTLLRHMLIDHSIEELIELTTKPALLTWVKFGKHKGQRWSEVDKSYLTWLLGRGDFSSDVLYTANHWKTGAQEQ